ncbi:trypsin-like peptidase domain-containing protein [Hansschlegelia sp. KR7-227]|uniref:trypsin-like peptidase domain-containing protein n=1 Tax=Hansschlegelia sp. KR7-227 TaxID=3400914 RepID=UPI003C0626DA
MLEPVLPSVVSIAVVGSALDPGSAEGEPTSWRAAGPAGAQSSSYRLVGSGVIVDARQGFILTNSHVVSTGGAVRVALTDGRSLAAKVIGADPRTDLAVVKVDAPGLRAMSFAAPGGLKVGDYVVAVGNPFGLGGTVTMGIVSALGRSGLGIEEFEDFIQTDASINPGNSGGPLVNLAGELVGVNNGILSPSAANVGIGFAIPVAMIRPVMEELIANGSISRGELGAELQDLTPALARVLNVRSRSGAVISELEPSGAAERAALRPGDVVLALDGAPVQRAADLRNAIGLRKPQAVARLTIARKDALLSVETDLLPAPPPQSNRIEGTGLLATVILRPADMTSCPNAEPHGAVVVSVGETSRAAMSGLGPDDVIVSVDLSPVRSPQETVDRTGSARAFVLGVCRAGRTRLVAVE